MLPCFFVDYFECQLFMSMIFRGWSETFCIANIEVMSMGVPLVRTIIFFILIHFTRKVANMSIRLTF